MTERLDVATLRWAEQEGIDVVAYLGAMRSWLDPAAQSGAQHSGAQPNPVHALERGELTQPEFERMLAERAAAHGVHVVGEGLLQRMFAIFDHAPAMSALVVRARAAGLRTALLSNSWGNDYQRDGWDDMFDVVVISGEVGLRKPEPAIFTLVCRRLGVAPAECVFVDDQAHNVEAAEALGMTGVLHTSYDEAAARLEALFEVSLSGG
ncbi:MAG: HAD-IA family hydrolase [Propionibacteriales bacterium]|nr:HAD-IA family hydrolase [Propionibacteriales bacterium]